MRYQSVFDETQEIQFAAVTMQLPDGSLFLAFRGTDSSIIGWKEDMKLTYLDEVPSQNLAWKYARDIYERYCVRKGLFRRRQQLAVPLYLGGHSKGGNLAMYVAIREQTIQPAITRVYNYTRSRVALHFMNDTTAQRSWIGSTPMCPKIRSSAGCSAIGKE